MRRTLRQVRPGSSISWAWSTWWTNHASWPSTVSAPPTSLPSRTTTAATSMQAQSRTWPTPWPIAWATAGLIENTGGKITVAAIAYDEDDGGIFYPCSNAQGGDQGSGGRYTAEYAFLGRQPARHLFSVSLGDQFETVDLAGLIDAWLVGLGPFADAGYLRAFGRLCADDLDVFIARAQIRTHTHDGARGTHRADKMGDLAVRLLPQFWPRGFDMGPNVVFVGELVQHLALAFGLHACRQIASVFHATLAGGCQDQFGAIRGHGSATLDRQIIGHDQDHLVAADSRSHGQGNAGIAAGGLDEGVPGFDLAALFRVADHGACGPVLDRSRGVVSLQLGQDDVASLLTDIAGNALQAYQWRSTDGVLDSHVLFHARNHTP